MSEYSWPDDEAARRSRAAWSASRQALPIGTRVTGKVIGRQRFGVFLCIDGVPDAIGLAEIIGMPVNFDLPGMGADVVGEVIWHAEHNHQVKIRLTP